MKDIILSDSLEGIGTDAYSGYLAHALCTGGKCTFRFNGHDFMMAQGDLIIVRKGKLMSDIRVSDDFAVQNLYVSSSFVELCTPQTNYGMRGQVSLFMNPVIHLDDEQRFVCERDFRWIGYRLGQTSHKFYREILANAVQAAILDFFDFHSTNSGMESVTGPQASIMNRFLSMLEDGTYRRHREVTYYADAICVTPKYLSEVSKRVSGYAANYWINRYTTLDLARVLRDKTLSLVQIASMFNFSSAAYFSRYVQHNLGMNPTRYRE